MEIQYKDADDKYVVFAMIFMLSNQLQAIGDVFFKEISTKQWFVLLVLNIMNGYNPTLNELSQAVGSSHQNVKQLVLKLEQKGFVELTKDETDARRLRIKATQKSIELNQAYHEKNEVFMDQLFNGFNKEELFIAKKVMDTMKTRLEGMKAEYVRE
jgi:DNA-binding MarR family transcriptional regulator